MEKFARHFFSRTTANTHTNMLRTRSTKHASSTLAAASKRVILSISSSRTFVGSFEEEDFEEVRMVGVVLLLLLVVARGETLLTAEIEAVEGETMYQFYE